MIRYCFDCRTLFDSPSDGLHAECTHCGSAWAAAGMGPIPVTVDNVDIGDCAVFERLASATLEKPERTVIRTYITHMALMRVSSGKLVGEFPSENVVADIVANGDKLRMIITTKSLPAYRKYVALYNISYPHKKISWRRLNRPQRARALELFGCHHCQKE